jgi:hypothetical protein
MKGGECLDHVSDFQFFKDSVIWGNSLSDWRMVWNKELLFAIAPQLCFKICHMLLGMFNLLGEKIYIYHKESKNTAAVLDARKKVV